MGGQRRRAVSMLGAGGRRGLLLLYSGSCWDQRTVTALLHCWGQCAGEDGVAHFQSLSGCWWSRMASAVHLSPRQRWAVPSSLAVGKYPQPAHGPARPTEWGRSGPWTWGSRTGLCHRPATARAYIQAPEEGHDDAEASSGVEATQRCGVR